jgi:hypothetical protein
MILCWRFPPNVGPFSFETLHEPYLDIRDLCLKTSSVYPNASTDKRIDAANETRFGGHSIDWWRLDGRCGTPSCLELYAISGEIGCGIQH